MKIDELTATVRTVEESSKSMFSYLEIDSIDQKSFIAGMNVLVLMQ